MGSRGDFDGQGSTTYTPNQIEAVLNSIGVEVDGETNNDFLCFCPFHGNRVSPSFGVSRYSGKYICFNAACQETGNLVELVMKIGKRNPFEARRLILKKAGETEQAFKDILTKALNPAPLYPDFAQDKLDQMYDQFWFYEEPQNYMHQRGFDDETLHHFRIGFSMQKLLIAVPMHDPMGNPVGVIGRALESKEFKNSKRLPTSKTLWNLHRAKRTGDTVIITEASFDAMRVHQAGYENVVACLGGNFSPYHFDLLDKHFSTIVLMTDFDKKEKHMYDNCKKCAKRKLSMCIGHNPGRDLGQTIAAGLHRKKILWASYEEKIVYPHDAKDAGDMTDDEIRQCLRNAVPNYVYQSWNVY